VPGSPLRLKIPGGVGTYLGTWTCSSRRISRASNRRRQGTVRADEARKDAGPPNTRTYSRLNHQSARLTKGLPIRSCWDPATLAD
jgi:hypothetical protein